MNIKKIEHLGIAVRDIEKGVSLYRDVLGLPSTPITREENLGTALAFVKIGESLLELMSPLEDPPIGSVGDIMRKFISSRGEGIHHLAVAVDDIEGSIKQLEKEGIALIDKVPRRGAHGKVAFAHPKSTLGVLIELCESCNHK